MNIIKSDFIAFAYTVKINSLGSTEADYDKFFDKLSHLNIKVEYKISEFDKSNRLHYHGILYLAKGFYRKRICLKPYTVKLTEIYNKAGWEKYIHKDCAYHNLPTSPPNCITHPPIPNLTKSLFK